MNLREATSALTGEILWELKKKKNVASRTILTRVLSLPLLPEVSLRKFNLVLIHQATLVSVKTSNFKIKYSFDFQARSREQGR